MILGRTANAYSISGRGPCSNQWKELGREFEKWPSEKFRFQLIYFNSARFGPDLSTINRMQLINNYSSAPKQIMLWRSGPGELTLRSAEPGFSYYYGAGGPMPTVSATC
jgi:hypothetical protein